jgi:hypothetical protein
MTAGDEYRLKAAELCAKAEQEKNPESRAELENLAFAYLRLAAQAERNSLTDVFYEPPLDRPGRVQQPPPSAKKDD